MNWMKTAITTGAALGLLGAAAYAHGPQGGYDYGGGPGMMGGYGMGPGMMDGYGPGGYGMHGWRGGDMGPGMMGGGFGPGMAGQGGLAAIRHLDLTDAQRQQLRKIEDELRRSNWNLMGQMQDEMAKARDAWSTHGADRGAVLDANKRMFELREKMLENQLDAQGKAEALLTPQQRDRYDKLAAAVGDSDDDD